MESIKTLSYDKASSLIESGRTTIVVLTLKDEELCQGYLALTQLVADRIGLKPPIVEVRCTKYSVTKSSLSAVRYPQIRTFREGENVASLTGLHSYEEVLAFLQDYL